MREMQEEWEQYHAKYGVKVDEVARHLWEHSELSLLETIAVKVAFLCERGKLAIPKNNVAPVIDAALVKMTNETFAFVGSLASGSLLGAYHHFRALIELRAGVHYIFAVPHERDRRVKKFTEWQHIKPYLKRRALERRVEKQEIDQAAFDRQNIISEELIAHATPARLDEWKALYGDDPRKAKLREWHAPDRISDMTEAISDGHTVDLYDIACNAAHFSPIGQRILGPGPMRLIGWTHERSVHEAIRGMIALNLSLAEDLSPHCGGVLVRALSPEADAFVRICQADRARPAPGAAVPPPDVLPEPADQ